MESAAADHGFFSTSSNPNSLAEQSRAGLMMHSASDPREDWLISHHLVVMKK
jgi:hypothetical protein